MNAHAADAPGVTLAIAAAGPAGIMEAVNQRTSPLAEHDDPGQRLRVLSYNVHVGIATSSLRHHLAQTWKHVLPFRGRRRNLARIARFISAFDVVGLQELDAGSLRSDFLNLAEYLAEQSGLHHWYSQTNRSFGRIAKHAMGALSRFPIHAVAEHRLPGPIPGRGALEVRLGSPDNPLVVVLAHLALGRRARQRQLGYLAEVLQAHEHAVLMGDFNCTPTSPEFRHLLARTHLCEPSYDHRTYPSWQPLHSLDHVLVTPGIRVEHGTAYHVHYSDHLPIGLDIVLPEGLRLDYRPPETAVPT